MSTQTQHTPGPWTCRIDDEGFNVFQDAPKHPGNGDHIMCIAGNDESEANARLIAAAPELLEALKSMHGILKVAAEGSKNGLHIHAIAMAETAIAKATVRTSN